MGKECMARLSRRLWGGTSLKTAAKEASLVPEEGWFGQPNYSAIYVVSALAQDI